MRERSRALLALLLLTPAPTVGVAMALIGIPGWRGKLVWLISKVWLFGLPVAWHVMIDRERAVLPRPQRRGMMVGLISGVAIFLVIVGGYGWLGRQWIDPQAVREVAERAGIATIGTYLGLSIYATFVNALLEEYVWRWFVYRQSERLVRRGTVAVVLAAMLFTIHHIVALNAYFDWRVTLLGSVGVFIGGATWSALYLHYRSIWPGYVSHILADVAVFLVGYWLIFGGGG
jgi:hypothetical protein